MVLRDDEITGAVEAEIRRFLFDAFGGGFTEDDWEHTAGGDRVVVFADETPVAHGALVPRALRLGDHEFRAGYVEGVATAVGWQCRGFGGLVMTRLTSLVRARFELGALSTSRRSFYERFGWESWRGPSYVIRDSDLVRTEDEDDGLMVLRFGPSAGVDLGTAIACHARQGDDW